MTAAFLTGDALAMLRQLPANMFHCCVTSPPYFGLRSYLPDGHPDKAKEIGSEPTPDEFVTTMVEVFREVRRVLRSDGVCFLNLGDSYASGDRGGGKQQTNIGSLLLAKIAPPGYKPKDLLMIPAQVALALRADGWYLRSEIIWHKPNPMPESVKNRPTASHEKIFMLTKSENYFWDDEAVKEPIVSTAPAGNSKRLAAGGGTRPDSKNGNGLAGSVPWSPEGSSGRNMRNVWTITNKPFKGSHYATFPPEIPERAIKAGTSEHGACRFCAAPFRRMVEKGEPNLQHQRACGGDITGAYAGQSQKNYAAARAQDASETKRRILAGMVGRKTIGWAQTCQCPPAPPWPCLVLDPFVGSGTTCMVAERLGRDSIGIDLDPRSIAMARQRVAEGK